MSFKQNNAAVDITMASIVDHVPPRQLKGAMNRMDLLFQCVADLVRTRRANVVEALLENLHLMPRANRKAAETYIRAFASTAFKDRAPVRQANTLLEILAAFHVAAASR